MSSSTLTSESGLYKGTVSHVPDVSFLHDNIKGYIRTQETVTPIHNGLEMSKCTAINVKLLSLHWRDSVGYSGCQVPMSFLQCDGKWANSTGVETLSDNLISVL